MLLIRLKRQGTQNFTKKPSSHAGKKNRQFILGFFLINTLLSLLVGLNYLTILPDFNAVTGEGFSTIFVWFFLIISFTAQVSMIFLFFCSFILVLSFFIPWFRVIFLFSIFLCSTLIFILVVDSIVFKIYHLHYAALGWEILKVNAFSQVISLSIIERASLIAVGVLLLLIESIIGWQVWQQAQKNNLAKWNKTILVILVCSIISSYGITLFARKATVKHGIEQTNLSYLLVKATRFIPYYDDMFHFILPIQDKIRHIDTPFGKVDFQIYEKNRSLNYPKQILQCRSASPLNIVIIGIDTWRFDSMNSRITPHIANFAKKSFNFLNHWSGGNCTQAGMFSLFYGIPANYWDAFLQQQRGPELIKQLIKARYKITVFTSAQLNFPAFDQTVFRDVKRLKIYTPGSTTIARDQAITQEFKKFLLSRNAKHPFFSFIFYDAPHNYCESIPTQLPFRPWITRCNRFSLTQYSDPKPYLNRYQNAVYFVDQQIHDVLNALREKDLLKNTIIIITGDHGEEINDNQSGYWQHASAYTSHQLHVPLLIYWPTQKPATYQHFTTHYDVAPTMMKEVLNCQNNFESYSIGESLFTTKQRFPLIAGGYADYAIISQDQIARVYRGGDYGIDNQKGHPIEKYQLKIKPLQQAFKYLNEFYAK